MIQGLQLVEKYNGRLPRYTSYPPVPEWKNIPSRADWFSSIKALHPRVSDEGVSLYIHLPFCEKLCTYCGCNKRITVNHAVERPYIEDILEEWRQYRAVLPEEVPIAELHLGGGTPTFFSPENLDYLLTELLRNTTPVDKARWSVEVHPSYTTLDQLEVLSKHGFKRLSIGVQTLQKKVQFLINRIQPLREVAKLTHTARALGFTSVNFDILYGLPLQGVEVVRDDIEQLLKLRPDRVAFYGYAHVPWKHAGQRRYTEADLPTSQERFASAAVGKQIFLDAGYKAIGMDHFALPEDALAVASKAGTLHRNFMGYTEMHSALLIGLGVSSISEGPLGYVQNDKQVESFREKLQSGQNTFVNGHTFSEQDQEMRQVILDIMCRLQLSVNHLSGADVASVIEEMELDGILENSDDMLQVTETGLPFLRNICALIDPLLHSNPENRYSSNV